VATDTIELKKHNEVYLKVICSDSTAEELSEYFTFMAPNYRFNPKYKARIWDGKIRLFNRRSRLIYIGLYEELAKFARERGYDFHIDELGGTTAYSLAEGEAYARSIKLPESMIPRPYQTESFVHCVRHGRSLFVSPTGSGKSLIIYMLLRHYNTKTLIIVDSLNLLNQMKSDFKEYGFNVDEMIHLISGGSDKWTDKPIVISTWQSAANMEAPWFQQFKLVIGDEAHRYKATSLKYILEAMTATPYRFGFTGSLDGSQTNQLVLEGLFGPYKKIKSTKDLMDEGYLSELEIKAITLTYTDEERKLHSKDKYEDELKFLYGHPKRNRFIENLALSLEGNSLVMFQRVEDHGIPLYEALRARAGQIPVYYVSGQTEKDDRESIRKIVNTHERSITVASVGTFSTGVNIPQLNNIIVAAPTKSVIRVLQTIGRGLRKTDTKTKCVVFDISDNLSWKKKINFTLKHFAERLKVYIKEDFKYKRYNVELK
jgi:superfamily II DNA or RNA helicase